MSDEELNYLILNEKKKLVDNKDLYEAVIPYGDLEMVKSVFFYDINFDSDEKRKMITDEKVGYKLLSNSISTANLEILKLLNEKGFNINEFNDNGITPLIQAIYYNKDDFVYFLVKQGADVNKKSKKEEYPIVAAVKKHNNKIVNFLYENGANLNQQDHKGNTALIYASQYGIVSSVECLIHHGADINIQNDHGLTALMTALISNRTEVVKILLNHPDIDLNIKSRQGMSAMMYAARQSRFENFDLLMDKLTNNIYKPDDRNDNDTDTNPSDNHDTNFNYNKITGFNINEKDNDGMNALLHTCFCGGLQIYIYISVSYVSQIMNSYYKIIKLLLDQGININEKSNEGKNALMIASQFGCLTIIKMLVEYGINIHEIDNDGKNALMYACKSNLLTLNEKLEDERDRLNEEYPNHEILNSLTRNLFDVEDVTHYKYSYDKGKCGYIHLVNYLVDQGINIYAKDNKGNNALMEAASHGFVNIIEYLIDQGVSIEERNNEGYTALMVASEHGYLSIVKYLIGRGADINALDNYGNHSLMLASLKGYIDIVEYLNESGLSIHTKNKDGKNALMHAIIGKHIGIVQYLYQQGVNLYDKDNYGCNALMLAAYHGQPDIVQFLCEKGMEINIIDNNGWTPLMYATFCLGDKKYPFTPRKVSYLSCLINNYYNIIKYLIEHGAQLDNKDKYGTTALMLAAHYGPLRTVKYLIQMGASLTIEDNKGNDVITYAKDSHFFENYINLMKAKTEKPLLHSYYTPIIRATCITKTTDDIFFCHNINNFKSTDYEILVDYLINQKNTLHEE